MFIKIMLLIITGASLDGSCEPDSDYIDLDRLFPSFQQALPPPPASSNSSPPSNFSIDVEKLNIKKFQDKINGELKKNVESDAKDARRYSIVHKIKTRMSMYKKALGIGTNLVGVDILLQMIYMAKSQMDAIESSTFFDTSNTAYRAGYLGFKMRKSFTKLIKIYNCMRAYAYSFYEMRGHVVLHHRSVKMHVDLLYFHWVLTVLDGIYRDHSGDKYKPRLPSHEVNTGGITIEDDTIPGFK